MDWADALPHLPFRVAVTDRKGRVLLLSGNIPGVRVGRSFLKLADAAEVVTVGRAAKRALADGNPRTLDSVTTVDKTPVSVKLMPFARDGGDCDHLLVLVGEVGALAEASASPAPPTATPEPDVPAPPDAVPTDAHSLPGASDTPNTGQAREAAPLPPMPVAAEVVVVAAGGTLPLARALESVLSERIKVRAWPVAKFVDVIGSRTGGDTSPEAVEVTVDPSTRVVFIGDSPWAETVRDRARRRSPAGRQSGWAISGDKIRVAAVWPGDPPTDPSDAVADLQFEMMEVVRRAMPIRKYGRMIQADPVIKAAAAFLESPASMDMSGKLPDQARHHQWVMAIARFMLEGIETLIGGDGG